MANVKISILTEFLGKGINDANKSVKGLEKSVKTLGYVFGGGFLGAKVLAFSKQAIAAFAADDKAAQTLTRTLSNLGLAFEDVRVRAFIDDLERTFGVVDDKLRPAFQKLLTTQGSVSEAQKTLRTALDLSAASGVDVTSVADDLAKAYVGQTRSLAKYGLGLSQAQLKGMKFEEVQTRINKLFGGQAALAAETYAGKIDRLKAAADRATEAIGKGFVDGLANLNGGGEGGLKKSISLIDRLGIAFGNFQRNFGVGLGQGLLLLQGDIAGAKALGDAALRSATDKNAIIPSIAGELSTKVFEDRMKAIREEAALAAQVTKDKKAQLSLERARVVEAKKKAVLDKASEALTQANKLFDDKAIQLAAAAQGKLNEEDKVRVKLKQDILGLEEAIAAGNVKAAASFSNSITQGSQQLSILRGDLAGFQEIPNPFNAWLETMRKVAAELAALANVPISQPVSSYLARGGTGMADFGGAAYQLPTNPFAGTYYGATGRDPMPVQVTLNIDGKTVADALVNTSNSGTSSSSARNTGQFN